jgi:hypothetical protein
MLHCWCRRQQYQHSSQACCIVRPRLSADGLQAAWKTFP